MKKIVYSFMICLILSIINFTPIYAANTDKVVDDADLLSEDEEKELNKYAMDIVEKYSFDVVMVTTNDLEGKTPEAYADDYFDYNQYGVGSDFDGILFLVSIENKNGIEDRNYWFSTTGYGIIAFTDYGIEQLGDKCVPYLSDGEYADAFYEFIDTVDKYLNEAKTNKPYDVNNKEISIGNIIFTLFLIIVFSFVAGFVTVTVMKSNMNTVTGNNNAREYIKKGSFNVTNRADIFLYSNVSKVKRETESSSSGGSSVHSGSSGRSHGGGGGKF